MGDQTWYRGEAEGVPSSSPGGAIHDLGDGTYYTSDLEVAKLYAQTRAKGKPEASRVYEVPIDAAAIQRVLDLTKNPKWNTFLQSRPVPGMPTVEQFIRQANENYGRFFQAFLKQERIDIRNYDAVIGPEFVRGGKQLCILMKNGQPSPIQEGIRKNFRLRFAGGQDVTVAKGSSVPLNIPTTNSKLGRIAGNQVAMAVLGQMLGSLALSIGEIAIERQVRKDLQTNKAKAIGEYLTRGDGVLVIVCLAQWKIPNDNGQRNKMLLDVYIEPGPTQQAALDNWRRPRRYLKGAPDGWQAIETYSWIAPAQ